jgi:hypothetical protein
LITSDSEKGGLVFWREAPGEIFAQRVDSLGVAAWISRQYSVAENVDLYEPMMVVSDRRRGAYVAWHGTDSQLYATRLNDSLLVRGDVTASSFVRRKDNGLVEPISTARAIGCPKGDADDLVFRVELQGQMMTPPPPAVFTLSWPGSDGVAAYRTAVADSAMHLAGDRYRTTITLREFGGCGADSVTVEAFGWPVATAPFDAVSPDIETIQSPGTVNFSDMAKFALYYPTQANPTPPYSSCADYVPWSRPDLQILFADWSAWGTHYGHSVPLGGSAPAREAVQASTGDVVLQFAEESRAGQRILKVAVALENVEPFTAAFLALRTENPLFEFSDWRQSASFPHMTMCGPTTRDGEQQLLIGVVGGKQPSAWNVELGTVELFVNSTAALELTEDDFALVTGDLLAATGSVLSVSMKGPDPPRKFGNSLSQNYPNPFNPATTIKYSLATAGHVDLTVYDVTGAVVKRLVNGERRPNNYRIVWDGRNDNGSPVASGIYFYRLRAPGFHATKKMLLLK